MNELEDFNELLNFSEMEEEIEPKKVEKSEKDKNVRIINDANEVVDSYKKKKELEIQKEAEAYLTEWEIAKTESSERKNRAKEMKDALIQLFEDNGYDELLLNGAEGLVMVSITYEEQEFLNKKSLAEALGVKQKELSKPHTLVQLTQEGKLTEELLEAHTMKEERMVFSVVDYIPNND